MTTWHERSESAAAAYLLSAAVVAEQSHVSGGQAPFGSRVSVHRRIRDVVGRRRRVRIVFGYTFEKLKKIARTDVTINEKKARVEENTYLTTRVTLPGTARVLCRTKMNFNLNPFECVSVCVMRIRFLM